MKTAAIILAAGKSSRMGKNKLLLKVEGHTVLDRLLDAVISSKVEDIVIVLGNKPNAIKQLAESRNIRTVLNMEHEQGMISSFITGLKTIDAEAAFLILGDQLGLTPVLLNSMIDYMKTNQEVMIVSPEYEGKTGHPSLFRGVLFNEILNLPKNENMKHIVIRHELTHRHVPGDIWNTMDFDTPEDFERVLNLFKI